MVRILIALVFAFGVSRCGEGELAGPTGGRKSEAAAVGAWHAWLITPDGPLPFGMELAREGGDWSVVIVNGEERIEVEDVRYEGGELVVAFAHYDSEIRAVARNGGDMLFGEWTKTRGDNVASVPFRAWHGERARFEPSIRDLATGRSSGVADGEALAGRWRIRFADSEDDAVGVFRAEGGPDGSNVRGTILTTTGDYRYLAGLAEERRLRLSCFDGAHAFLLDARVQGDGSLAGTFTSGDWYETTWTGVRDESVELPDMFSATSWNEEADLSEVVFRNLEGEAVRLTDERFAGRPMVVEVMGTWCPNCNDAAAYTARLHERYGDRVRFVMLAFELTEDFARSAEQVRRFRDRHGIGFEVLIAGLADKERASAFFPVLDRVRSYPTTIFMDAGGEVRGVHTGFAGPATGEAYEELKGEFEGMIEGMLE